MTPEQIKLAEKLKDIQFQQPADSQYWHDDGGKHIWELAKEVGLTEQEGLTAIQDLEKNGKAELTLRKDGKEGARLTSTAIAELDIIETQKRQIAEAAATAQAQQEKDNEIIALFTRARELGLF